MLSLPADSSHRVRPARRDELLELAELRRLSWWQAYRGVLPARELRTMNDRRTARRMAGALRSSVSHILVVEAQPDRPLGYAWLGPHRERFGAHRGEIYELYLHPRAQGQGAGRRLLVDSIWALVDRGFHPVLVWVLAANPARHFYAACGGECVAQGPVNVAGRTLTRLAYSWQHGLPLPGTGAHAHKMPTPPSR